MDESDPTASLALSEELKTAMSRLVQAMAALCFLYDVDVINLGEKHELDVGENQTGKLDFVPVDLCFNIRKDQNRAHVVYGVFDLNNFKDMVKVLGDYMKSGAPGHLFRSALRFAHWYEALASEQNEARDTAAKDSIEGRFQSDENEGVELQPVFEIEKSLLRYKFLWLELINRQRLRSVRCTCL